MILNKKNNCVLKHSLSPHCKILKTMNAGRLFPGLVESKRLPIDYSSRSIHFFQIEVHFNFFPLLRTGFIIAVSLPSSFILLKYFCLPKNKDEFSFPLLFRMMNTRQICILPVTYRINIINCLSVYFGVCCILLEISYNVEGSGRRLVPKQINEK